MRIGDINNDNYKLYQQLLGIKSDKALDDFIDGDEKLKEKDYSFEAREKRMVELGYAEEGMMIREGDTSWRKIVPVSKEIKDKIIETVRRQFLSNANGMSTAGDGDEIGAIMKEYRKNIPAGDRLSVTWTLGEIASSEVVRLAEFVKAKVPGWEAGKPFDPSIFEDYHGGIDIRV